MAVLLRRASSASYGQPRPCGAGYRMCWAISCAASPSCSRYMWQLRGAAVRSFCGLVLRQPLLDGLFWLQMPDLTVFCILTLVL